MTSPKRILFVIHLLPFFLGFMYFWQSFKNVCWTQACFLRRWALEFSVLRFWLFFRSVFRFLCQKTSVFRFWCSLWFADFPFFSFWFSIFAKNTNGFSVLISDAVFGFSYLTYLGSGLSSIWVAIKRLHWSRIAAKCKCYREECMTNQFLIGPPL